MKRKDFNQIFYLNKEAQMWQRELDEIELELSYHSPLISGMPKSKTNIPADPTGELAERRMERKKEILKIIQGILSEIQLKRKEIFEYISELDDSLLRQIIFYRCISCMTWAAVACQIGGKTTPDGARKIFNRHFKI